jgi:hypothetical protein
MGVAVWGQAGLQPPQLHAPFNTLSVRYLKDACCINRVTGNEMNVRLIFGYNLGQDIRDVFLIFFLVDA